MKNNEWKTYHNRVIINVLYSTIITCMIEVFAVINITKIADYLVESQVEGSVVTAIANFDTIVVLLFVLMGIVIFSLTFWLLQRKAIAYINKISLAIRDIASGDLNVTIDVNGDDEFSEMAENLNTMVAELKDLMDRERESERTKNELITNIAHDLRTPLTSIIGYLELLSKKDNISEDIRKQYTEIAYAKTKRLEKLIEDLFGFTKLTYGKITMKVDRIDIVKLLSQLIDEFFPKFEEKNLSYELQTNVPTAVISADANLLARLFDNLINNAIKYGADGKLIKVQVIAEDNVVTIAVINYGKVIPEEELPLIFNKFYRVEQSRSSGTGGTGLGLAIAKNIVSMHGGTINVTSDLNGTAFTVKLKTDFDINKENFANV